MDKPTSYINDDGQELSAGDHWYVRLYSSLILEEIVLTDVTQLTVKYHVCGNHTEYRRETKNIKFIEKVST